MKEISQVERIINRAPKFFKRWIQLTSAVKYRYHSRDLRSGSRKGGDQVGDLFWIIKTVAEAVIKHGVSKVLDYLLKRR